jgi:glycosyltransferase involved in cell wall biosynthesis
MAASRETADPMNKLVSIVSPCFNEEDNVESCYQAVRQIFESELAGYDWEHIFADNASTDRTVEVLRQIASTDQHVRVIVNARNYGPFRSTFNALRHCRGDAVLVVLAVDLQDPPELIPEFVRKWEAGYPVVYGIRRRREESVLLRTTRRIYYRLVKTVANIELHTNVGEFQLIDRRVLKAVIRFDDYYPYIRGLIANCGFKSTGIEYTWRARKKGISKNSLVSLVDQGLNGLVSFSNVPIRLATVTGFAVSALSTVYALATLTIDLVAGKHFGPPGTATLIVGMFFLFGLVLFFQGLIGEYVGAIHAQVRHQGFVIEQERINFGDEASGHRPSPQVPRVALAAGHDHGSEP